MGMDSGDDRMLLSLRKGNIEGVETNRKAAKFLRAAGIKLCVSFVLGAVGETEESLQNTYHHAQELLEMNHIVVVDPSVILPLPGAPAWRMMMEPTYAKERGRRFGIQVKDTSRLAKKYADVDNLDTEALARDWVNHFCKVDYECLQDYGHKIRDLGNDYGAIVGGFGVRGF
jgi:radical SAM superfamily enzyme YgiQ (UPF0313 family)